MKPTKEIGQDQGDDRIQYQDRRCSLFFHLHEQETSFFLSPTGWVKSPTISRVVLPNTRPELPSPSLKRFMFHFKSSSHQSNGRPKLTIANKAKGPAGGWPHLEGRRRRQQRVPNEKAALRSIHHDHRRRRRRHRGAGEEEERCRCYCHYYCCSRRHSPPPPPPLRLPPALPLLEGCSTLAYHPGKLRRSPCLLHHRRHLLLSPPDFPTAGHRCSSVGRRSAGGAAVPPTHSPDPCRLAGPSVLLEGRWAARLVNKSCIMIQQRDAFDKVGVGVRETGRRCEDWKLSADCPF